MKCAVSSIVFILFVFTTLVSSGSKAFFSSGLLKRRDPYWDNVVLLIQPTAISTTGEDLSASNHSLSFINGAAFSNAVSDPWGGNRKVITLNGVNDKITIPDHADWSIGSGDVTIEAWVYFKSFTTGGVNCIYDHFQASTSYYTFCVDNAANVGAGFFANDAGSYSVSFGEGADRTSPIGQWAHYAYTRSGSTHRVFINGVLAASTTDSSSIRDYSGSLIIGGSSAASINAHIGSVRVTKGISRYNANFTPPTAPFPTPGNAN